MDAKTYKRNTIVLAMIVGLLCGAVMYSFCMMMASSMGLVR